MGHRKETLQSPFRHNSWLRLQDKVQHELPGKRWKEGEAEETIQRSLKSAIAGEKHASLWLLPPLQEQGADNKFFCVSLFLTPGQNNSSLLMRRRKHIEKDIKNSSGTGSSKSQWNYELFKICSVRSCKLEKYTVWSSLTLSKITKICRMTWFTKCSTPGRDFGH